MSESVILAVLWECFTLELIKPSDLEKVSSECFKRRTKNDIQHNYCEEVLKVDSGNMAFI